MALTHDDFIEIKKELDERYVLQSDCNERQEANNKKFANDHEQIALILAEQKQLRKEQKSGFTFNNWLTAGILAALIVGFIGFYFFVG